VLYPNPFNDAAVLQFPNPYNFHYQLKIFDSRGRLVRSQDGLTGEKVIIYKGGLQYGMYYYSLRTGHEKPVTGKFIISQ
jgi:hypothetical protein